MYTPETRDPTSCRRLRSFFFFSGLSLIRSSISLFTANGNSDRVGGGGGGMRNSATVGKGPSTFCPHLKDPSVCAYLMTDMMHNLFPFFTFWQQIKKT